MAEQKAKAPKNPFNVDRALQLQARATEAAMKLVMKAGKYAVIPATMLADVVNGSQAVTKGLIALSEERESIVKAMEERARLRKAAAEERATTGQAAPDTHARQGRRVR